MRSSAPVEFTGRPRPCVVERIGHGRRILPTLPRSTRSTAGGRPVPPARASGLAEPRHEFAPHRREAAVRRIGYLVRHSHEVASKVGRASVRQGRSPRALPTCGRRSMARLPHDRPAAGVDPVARPAHSQHRRQQRASRAVIAACRAAGRPLRLWRPSRPASVATTGLQLPPTRDVQLSQRDRRDHDVNLAYPLTARKCP